MKGIIVLALLWALSSSSEASADDGKAKDGGRYWAPRGADPDFPGFDFGGNGIAVDPECGAVAEGRHFLPFDWATTNTRAEEADTVAGTLALGRDNTVLGFIDYLTDTEVVTDPLLICARILEEVSPQCAAVPDTSWGQAMRDWYGSLVRRVTDYVMQETIG